MRTAPFCIQVLPFADSVAAVLLEHVIVELDELVIHAMHDLVRRAQFFDFHVTTDGLPFQGREVPELGGWMRFETAPDSITKSHLVCLIDVWPPVPVTYYDRMVPLSTINWGIHFAEPLDGVQGDAFLGYLGRVNFFSDGYGSTTAHIWAPDGRLLAKSYQTFVMYG